MGIGRRIKEAREKLGLTQKELGDLLGVTGSAVTNYENEVSHPKEPIMYKMFEALKVDANYLFQDAMSESENLTILQQIGELDKQEESLIHTYRQLNTDGQEKLLDYADDLVMSGRYDFSEEEQEEAVRVFRAAHSKENKDSEIVDVPKSLIERLRAAKPVDEI